MRYFPLRYGIIRFSLVCVIACARPLHSPQWFLRKESLILNENICSLSTYDFHLVSLSLSFFFTFFLELGICLSTNLCSAPFNSFNHLVWGCIVDTKADGLCQMLFLTLKPNNKTKLTMAGE